MALTKQKHNVLKESFSSLRIRNYRLYFSGNLFSLFGDMMQSTAQGYLIYELTNSPSFLGYVTFANGLPSWLLMLFAGVIVDRIFSKRRLMLVTISTMMLLAFILSFLVFTDIVLPWHILILALILGIANAFNTPARQAFVADLVPKNELSNAIALNSMMFNLARVVGPTAAGIAYALFGPAWCFLINAITFLFIIGALLLMRFSNETSITENKNTDYKKENLQIEQTEPQEKMFVALGNSFKYIWSDKTTFWLIIAVFMIGFSMGGFVTLFPVWATEILHGGVEYNGYLLSFRGMGSVIGALIVASLSKLSVKGILFTIGSFLTPVLMLGFTFTRTLPTSLGFLFFTGLVFMLFVNTCNSMVQERVADQLRGRVMSVYSLSLMGAFSLGGLVISSVAERINTPVAMQIGSIILLSFSLVVFIFYPKMRKTD
jgi:MFS family permease